MERIADSRESTNWGSEIFFGVGLDTPMADLPDEALCRTSPACSGSPLPLWEYEAAGAKDPPDSSKA
jgi:hypothetical protein